MGHCPYCEVDYDALEEFGLFGEDEHLISCPDAPESIVAAAERRLAKKHQEEEQKVKDEEKAEIGRKLSEKIKQARKEWTKIGNELDEEGAVDTELGDTERNMVEESKLAGYVKGLEEAKQMLSQKRTKKRGWYQESKRHSDAAFRGRAKKIQEGLKMFDKR